MTLAIAAGVTGQVSVPLGVWSAAWQRSVGRPVAGLLRVVVVCGRQLEESSCALGHERADRWEPECSVKATLYRSWCKIQLRRL